MSEQEKIHSADHLDAMFQNWFLDYASYVILERAVPAAEDGLKPVQRRILHALNQIHDGRFHKVANVIGQTMQYHPHGDASIGDALVNIGQKDLLFDCQGNWGDVRTGDGAAAPRYIEVRLSKFAKDISFIPEITEWQLSYDGRKKEPVTLPMKFPLLLSHGAEGIAVGLSTKILPHNFNELIKASVDLLKGKKVKLYPDFPTGGQADVSDYQGGSRGGRVKVRARIEIADKKTLVIKEIPFSTTTSSLIESILKANDKGKIKIKKVTDNTAKDVDIQIELAPGAEPDITMDALYAFTDCQVSISPNACVIVEEKPLFLTVEELLRISTERTRDLLRRELEIEQSELNESWHFSSLEKIFIEKRIYRNIEECETWEAVIETIDKGLKPYKKLFKREIVRDDIVRLTEIKIKRISKYDAFKADEEIRKLEERQKQVQHHLDHITDYTIAYFEQLLQKYGKGRERRTELKNFETIEVKQVVAVNSKLYVNRDEGFIGKGLKKDEFVCDCSDIDDIITITRSGKMMVNRLEEKKFVGKDILHVAVWQKNDERTTYHLVYVDGQSKRAMVKRFQVTSITRDKEYDLTAGNSGSKVLYLTVHPHGETEVVNVQLHPSTAARVKEFAFDFATLDIKGRQSQGNVLTKYPVRKVMQKSVGASSLGGIKIWMDEEFGRLNKDGKGRYLGSFHSGDRILVMYRDGQLELTDYELTNKFDPEVVYYAGKFDPERVLSLVHFDGKSKQYYVKRFKVESLAEKKKTLLISDAPASKLAMFSVSAQPAVKHSYTKGKDKMKFDAEVKLADIVDVKGWKALGNRLTQYTVTGKITDMSPAEEVTEELEVGSTMEWEVTKAGKGGKQGDLF